MADVYDVHEATGALIGAIPISPLQRRQLHEGTTISIVFHTPRELQPQLGQHNGIFEVMELEGKLLVTNPDDVKRYIELQEAIANAKSNPPVW